MTAGDRVVIITGGGSGLGYELTRLHLAKGDQVVILGRDRDRLAAAKHKLGDPQRLYTYPLDVSDQAQITLFAAWIAERFNRCDILYNNAGSALFKPFVEMSADEIKKTLAVNFEGVLFMTHAFLPLMLAQKRGQIVCIASLAGEVATAKATVYAASKAAVIRFCEGLRQEVAAQGIVVTCILPGPIDTPFLDLADQSGTYRDKVGVFLLRPDRTAQQILRAVENKRSVAAMPRSLYVLQALYRLLPSSIQALVAPLFNRK